MLQSYNQDSKQSPLEAKFRVYKLPYEDEGNLTTHILKF